MRVPGFSRLEQQIMEVLWQRGRISIREVQEALPAPQPAYTSVQTTIYRLEAKHAVRRVRKIGNAHIFEASVSRNAAHGRLLDHVLGLFGGRIQPVMAHWAESGNITEQDVEDAERLLRELVTSKTAASKAATSKAVTSKESKENPGKESMIPFALNHIWQSTAFAAVAALLAVGLRRYPANVRFWLWMSASLKFLVPFAVLAVIGGHLPSRSVPIKDAPPMRSLTGLAQPFAPVDGVDTKLSPLNEHPARSSLKPVTPRLFVLWLVGFASILGRRLFESLRLNRLRGAARPARGFPGPLPIPVLLTDSGVEPGVFGIVRPVLFLPTDISDRLSPTQVQVVIAHEMVHVQRRDNLWAALHAMVQAIFWFHPLVWWMGRRLVIERERACDEAVLAQGADAEGYAASILAVCRYYACVPQVCLSSVTGADLKQRIAAIMRFGVRRNSAWIRVGLAALAVGAVITPIILGQVYGPPSQDSSKLKFDVASVHEWGPGQGPTGPFAAGVQFSAGRVRSQCASLKALIFYAYQLTGSEPLEGLPKWGDASCGYPDSAGAFTIDATMPVKTTDAQSRQMMQALLAERFKLGAHWETRQLPTYALITASGSSKLKPSDPDKDPPVPPHSIGCPADDVRCHIGFCCGSTTITVLTGTLSHALGRPVIDKTGLTGTYYFGVLKWAGDESVGSSLPSLPAMLRDEFGLELKSEPGPVPVLIIDHAEKLMPN